MVSVHPEIEASTDTTTEHHAKFIDWAGGGEVIGRTLSYTDPIGAGHCCHIQFPYMTTIACAYTSEGFVVGADGLRVSGKTSQELSQEAQKIFIIDHPAFHGVHAWVGAAQLFSIGSTFDFPEETQKIIKSLSGTGFAKLSDFVACIGNELYRQLVERGGIVDPAILQKNTVTGGLFVGYISNRAQRVQLDFPHENGLLSPPVVGEVSEAPKDFFILGGSNRVWDDLGKVQHPSSRAEAVDLVRRYIQHCIDKRGEDPECKDTGGKIHIAIVTPDKVEWNDPPIPRPT